jgi:hypothetical protein
VIGRALGLTCEGATIEADDDSAGSAYSDVESGRGIV